MTKPITLYDHEVRAWQARKLSLLLRPVKPQLDYDELLADITCNCPFPPGSYYVKEEWFCEDDEAHELFRSQGMLHYRANATTTDEEWFISEGWVWRFPVTMPRWASRGNIEIVENGICRLKDLTLQELVDALVEDNGPMAYEIWDQHFGKQFPADSNPYLWRLPVKNGS